MTDEDKVVKMAEEIYTRKAVTFSDHTDKKQAVSDAFACAVAFYSYRRRLVSHEITREILDEASDA